MIKTAFAPIYAVNHGSIFARLGHLILQWQSRAEQRFALAQLDNRMLRDIGIDHTSAKSEAAKPFWRP